MTTATDTDNGTPAPDTSPPRRGSPAGSRTRAATSKRHYARDLAELKGRVETAVRLLRKVDHAVEGDAKLVAVAIETLEGTP